MSNQIISEKKKSFVVPLFQYFESDNFEWIFY